MQESKITVPGLIIFSTLLILAAFGLMYLGQSIGAVSTAGVKAEATFAAAHPYNTFVQHQFVKFQQAAAKAKQSSRPAPGWNPTPCEEQTLDLRDYDRYMAEAKAAARWPASMLLTAKHPPIIRAFTAECEAERAGFAALHPAIR